MAFTEDEIKQALTYARNGAMFMFRAGENTSKEILNGHPLSAKMPKFIQSMIISREWINIDSVMVIKYCTNTLDQRNKYLFDDGDIKVIPEPWRAAEII